MTGRGAGGRKSCVGRDLFEREDPGETESTKGRDFEVLDPGSGGPLERVGGRGGGAYDVMRQRND